MRALFGLLLALVLAVPCNAQTAQMATSYEYYSLFGQTFISGSGAIAVALNGNLRFVFTNPSASGKTCYVSELEFFATGTVYGTLIGNPAQTPATTAPITNASLTGVTPVCTVKYDNNATTLTGTATGVTLPFIANLYNVLNTPFPLFAVPPGTSLGINVPYTTIAGTGLANIRWIER